MFPWLTVEGNIGFGLSKLARDEREQRIAHYVKMVGLQGFEKAYPSGAFRRHEAAAGSGARSGGESRHAVAGRAFWRARFHHAADHARRTAAHLGGGAKDDHLRDARYRRSGAAGRSGGGHERAAGHDPADRQYRYCSSARYQLAAVPGAARRHLCSRSDWPTRYEAASVDPRRWEQFVLAGDRLRVCCSPAGTLPCAGPGQRFFPRRSKWRRAWRSLLQAARPLGRHRRFPAPRCDWLRTGAPFSASRLGWPWAGTRSQSGRQPGHADSAAHQPHRVDSGCHPLLRRWRPRGHVADFSRRVLSHRGLLRGWRGQRALGVSAAPDATSA